MLVKVGEIVFLLWPETRAYPQVIPELEAAPELSLRIETGMRQLMEGIADEAQRAAVTIARDNMLSEILKLTNPPAPRKGKAKAEAKADTTSATEAKN